MQQLCRRRRPAGNEQDWSDEKEQSARAVLEASRHHRALRTINERTGFTLVRIVNAKNSKDAK